MNPTPALPNAPQPDLQEVAALLRYEQMVQLEMASFRRSDCSAERIGGCRGTANRSHTLMANSLLQEPT